MNNKQITTESIETKKSYLAPTYEIDKFTIYCEVPHPKAAWTAATNFNKYK